MSFILKALKKVEEEKAARTAAPVDLNRVILADGSKKSRGSRKLALALMMVLVFAAGSAFAWYFAFTRKMTETVAPVVASAPVQQTPDHSAEVTAPALPAHVEKPMQIEPALKRVQPEFPATPVSREPKSPKAAPIKVTPALGILVAAPQGLTLNGIAVQDDPAESIAIVNGIILKRGMSVNGVRVENIHPEKVRFFSDGGYFELQLPR